MGMGLTAFGVSGANAQGPPPGYYNQPWAQYPGEYRSDISHRAFHDGIEGARRDFENHRQPNVNNRDEFRHPPYRGHERREYRHAFERGYEVGVQHIYEGRRY
jgi:hypothetical protein